MTSSLIFDLVARDKGFDTTMAGGGNAAEKLGKRLDDAAKRSGQGFTNAARDIGSSLEKMERDAWDSAKGTDEAFTQALRSMRSDFERIREAGRLTGSSLDSDLGGALRDLKRQMDELGDEAKQTGKEIESAFSEAGQEGGSSFGEAFSGQLGGGFDVGGMIESLTGGAGGAIATAGAALGGALAAAEWEAFEAYFDQKSLGGVIAAQQGASVSEAGKFGRVAGQAYYSGFADSVEEGGAALSGVLGQGLIDTDASQAEIQKLTDMAATAAKVVGADANEIGRAAKQLLVTGLAGNAQEAIDLIVSASQQGANAAGDFLETVNEYAVQFQGLGLDGADAIGLISQAMQAGARDSDYAADALKEFNILAKETSNPKVRAGFQAIGLDADVMAKKISAGGSSARDALDQTLDGLRAIESPAQRSQIAVALFGTKAEDLAGALYAMDLDTVSAQFDDVAGSTDRAAATIAATQSPVEKLGRGLEQVANIAVGGFASLNGEADVAEKTFTKTANKVGDFRSDTEKLADAQHNARNAIAQINTAATEYVQTLEEIISAQEQLANDFSDSERAGLGYNEAIMAANQAIIDNKKNTDLMTEGGIANKDALLDISDAAWKVVDGMESQSASAAEVQGFMATARDQFVSTAISMGYGAAEANRMADKLHLIPGDYNARVRADTAGANGSLDFTLAKLNAISRIYTASVQIRTSGAGILGQLGIIPGRASGGPVEQGDIYRVGEEGEEWFVPDRDGTIIPNDMLTATASKIRPSVSAGWGGGGSSSVAVMLEWVGGPSDDMGRAAFDYIRDRVAVRHGGSVTAALGQRGVV